MHLDVHDDTPKSWEAVSRVMEIAAVPGLGHILSMNDLGVIFVPRSFTLPIKLLGSILEALILMTATSWVYCSVPAPTAMGGEDDMAQDAAFVGCPLCQELLVEGVETLHLLLHFLQLTLGILTLQNSPIILPSRHLLDTVRVVTYDDILRFGLVLDGERCC